ncbi:amidohydrolase [Sporosarcina pasteurii]|uniref:Indole-3-acetyl-aspartic acid hydrolase n=1 Tax=Sporosarcina pasteurii TaxID=1474 RepID=A0A380C0G0_SPOPA|nr:amidohydrolase [Sporosarcina pasteurii]MDS9471481.1 amidohydrolase [Sporosarcina pasteurii]QBQ04898.1 amidohydrolase [Sporosarcina pasteurii]SUJ10504.1 Indole-3-acetyl-aspartic acid hydrolase [Sporosarcina pasteurii]
MQLEEQVINWRRNFHRFPEQGFLEMRTASIVASVLDELGFDLQMGKSVMKEEACMGKPNAEITDNHVLWAKQHGAIERFLPFFQEGYTGIVASLQTNRPGPTVAFRFDMDALPIVESDSFDHAPMHLGFRSISEGTMHACGHDAHTAIGLGLATLLSEHQAQLTGVIKLIFQPAEEGTRGAKAMASAGVVDDVDYFIAAHIGTGVPKHHFVAANNGFLATSKLDITFSGKSSHAGSEPQKGKNALLAAASAALNMHAVSRHSSGDSRVNVGELHAGSGRNIVANHATMKVETRGETSEVNDYMKEQIENIVDGAARMYDVEQTIELAGEAISCKCSEQLAKELAQIANQHSFIENVTLLSEDNAGSEDATYFLNAVQERGGQATYCIFGTDLAAGHHHEKFDIDEDTLLPAVEILFETACKFGKVEKQS